MGQSKKDIIKSAKGFEFYVSNVWPIHRMLVGSTLAKRCVKCAASEHMISLDAEQVCEECKNITPSQNNTDFDTSEDLKAFNTILDEAQCTGGGQYDALIPYSGGKDSSYLIRRIQKEFPQLRILAFSMDNGFMSPIAKENIDNLYDYIIAEQKDTVQSLKESLILRVHEAHAITTNIYNEFKDKYSREEITLMIRSALKDIRFNNQRGYFFVYDKTATNIIHPLIPRLEGKNLINYQDTKGIYVLRESLSLLNNKDESYQEWHWRKIKGNPKEFKKIGFVKNIYELDWFL